MMAILHSFDILPVLIFLGIAINPGTIAAALSIANTIKSLFSKKSGGGDLPSYDKLLPQLREKFSSFGGAAQRQNEAILKQGLAGSSKAKSQSVLGQQLNQDVGAIFQALSEAEIQALRMLIGAKSQQEYLKAQQDRDLLDNLSKLGSAFGALKEGGVSKEGGMDFQQLIGLLSQNPTKLEPKLDYQSQPTTDIPLRLK